MSLPNNDPLGGSEVHAVGLLYMEGGVPFGEVSGRHVGTQVAGAVDVHLQQQSLVLGLCLLAPHSCPVGEVLLKGNALCLGHDVQGDSHTAVVGDVLADGELAVDGSLDGF